ncbi:MAG: DUF3160 domain-containing protein [Clostridiales bacterium]|nr:DUF3160 domain-containing protein [Clostridiales bacterium]
MSRGKKAASLAVALSIAFLSIWSRSQKVALEDSQVDAVGGSDWQDASEHAQLTPADEKAHESELPLKYKNPSASFEPISVSANAESTVELLADLSNIENISSFPNLTQNQKDMLLENRFVATPTTEAQMFYIYEENEYKAVPSFVTSDSILQLFQIFYEYSLRTLEESYLMEDIFSLTDIIFESFKDAGAQSGEAGEALSRASAFFGVAAYLMMEDKDEAGLMLAELPEEALLLAEAEIDLIEHADANADSPLTGAQTDYTEFIPRGHYLKNEETGRYYQVMRWYSCSSFEVMGSEADFKNLRCVIAIASVMLEKDLIWEWENIYSSSAFFLGSETDLTTLDICSEIMTLLAVPADESEEGEDSEKARESKAPGIADRPEDAGEGDSEAEDESIAEKPGFTILVDDAKVKEIADNIAKRFPEGDVWYSFIGRPTSPDRDILSRLSDPQKRPIPSGLDLAAALGSATARKHIDMRLKPQDSWPGYIEELEDASSSLKAIPADAWLKDMKSGWLWALAPLIEDKDIGGYPFFMQTDAWNDKSLSAALGGWTQFQHDAALSEKPPAAETGGWPSTVYPGYVEPSIGVYERLLWLAEYMRENLESRELANEEFIEKCSEMEGILEFLINCSQIELAGQTLSALEQNRIAKYGGMIEKIATTIASDGQAENWYQIEPETDRRMAFIAEVFSSDGKILCEAVGNAAELFAVVEVYGKLYLTRGAIFDYFEVAASYRVTDEQWQIALEYSLDQDTVGVYVDQMFHYRPEWTASFIDTTGVGEEIPNPSYDFS